MHMEPTQSAAGITGFQGLSGERLVSPDGVGILTGHSCDGPAYLVTFWLDGSLAPEALASWETERRSLTRERALLGQKGARTAMAALDARMDAAFERLMASAGRDSGLDAQGRESLAAAVAADQAIALCCVTVLGAYAEVLFSLEGETGVDTLVARWKSAVGDGRWSDGFYARAVQPDACERHADRMIEALGCVERQAVAGDGNASEDEAAPFSHVTVLLHETVDMLDPREGKVIVDATLGGGGHTELLLERGATVWGIDQDPDARRAAARRLSRFGSRFRVLAGNFRNAAALLAGEGVDKIDGLLADLGISSHQVDTPERGFSFREDGPLDMRMDPSIRTTAADFVNTAAEEELADVIWQYGEEKASRRIARAIVKARAEAPITTTARLAAVISSVLPRKGRQHPGTRTFQALRIFINDELGALDSLLESSVDLLAPGGRMAVITFHSLEDRRVKQFLDLRSRPEIDRKEWPAPRPNPDYAFRLLNKKPLTAAPDELAHNPRSRSAKLRGAEKIK